MMRIVRILSACVAALLLLACSGTEPDWLAKRRVVLMYAAAYSNLSGTISEDVKELCAGELPGKCGEDVLLVYAHHTKRYGDYKTPTNPVLYRVYKDLRGNEVHDTLTVYPDTDISSSAEVLHKVLSEVKETFPARSYGLVFSSHARGWLPVNYSEPEPSLFSLRPKKYYPLTKWLGIENVDGSGIDIRDLASAIPMKLDFFIMDACLMGCAEVAYELRDKCNYIVFSPTEILADGFVYTTMGSRLLNVKEPDLKQVCQDYYDFYAAQSGYYASATITMVDCSKMEDLAVVCRDLVQAHREEMASMERQSVQPYFYNELHWFYDLRDVFACAGATEEELARLDAALAAALPYAAATDHFFDLKLERVCGISMYYPYPDKDELNAYYKTLAWNRAVGLL